MMQRQVVVRGCALATLPLQSAPPALGVPSVWVSRLDIDGIVNLNSAKLTWSNMLR